MDFGLTDEQTALRDAAAKFAADRLAPKAFTWNSYPWENAKALAAAGLTGIAVPVEFGGQGGTLLDAVVVEEEISKVCPHSGDVLHVTNFAAIRQIMAFGGSDLARKVVADVINGDALVTVGMSEPEAGSAVTELRTKARRESGSVVIDGMKSWNSNGPEATHVVVWCRFGPGADGIGAVLVPADAPGFSKGPRGDFMSGDGYCELFFDGCTVDESYLLTEEHAIKRLLANFNVERLGNACRSLSLGQAAFELALRHAVERTQFGRRLADNQGIKWKLADMSIQLEAARLLVYRAAAVLDTGEAGTVEMSVAKTHANETGFFVANHALQIFGASGYAQPSPIDYIFRKVRGWMIAGGSVEIQRDRIAAELLRPFRSGSER